MAAPLKAVHPQSHLPDHSSKSTLDTSKAAKDTPTTQKDDLYSHRIIHNDANSTNIASYKSP